MKIVFICTGNASRSAAADVVLREMAAEKGITNLEIASCGTHNYGRLQREGIMCRIAAEKGYEMGGWAVPMTEELLNSADLLIVMTSRHREEVTRLLTYSHWDRIARFNDFCFGDPSDLPDPHYQTYDVYRTCFDIIERGCQEIINKLLT